METRDTMFLSKISMQSCIIILSKHQMSNIEILETALKVIAKKDSNA